MDYKDKFTKTVPVKSLKVPTKLISGYLKTLDYKDVRITPIIDDKEHVSNVPKHIETHPDSQRNKSTTKTIHPGSSAIGGG